MYKINKTSNNVVKLEQRLFKELHLKEREHLQEWIAKNPEMLGEELLIIQKEYDGFNDTNERLDLLALDKDGGLVIIENKLDDTGRDVVWQALKYTSYCSTLTTSQIIKIYQSYLERKTQYESWLDEMAIEVQNEFENTMNEAKEIKSNLRLQQAIEKFEQYEGKNTLQDKVEFYLYLNQEIINNKTFGKGKK